MIISSCKFVMKSTAKAILDNTLIKYSYLKGMENDIIMTFDLIRDTYQQGGKLLVCGNGGSASDSDHIVGELMKGFMKKRPLGLELKQALQQAGMSVEEAENLQAGLPAINLSAHAALITATINDINGEMIFAQQVLGYGKQGDVLLGISTSGNSKNVQAAVRAAKALGLKTIGMTGALGGELAKLCDVTIKVPERETYKIQELHLPVYHALCAMIEEEFFAE